MDTILVVFHTRMMENPEINFNSNIKKLMKSLIGGINEFDEF